MTTYHSSSPPLRYFCQILSLSSLLWIIPSLIRTHFLPSKGRKIWLDSIKTPLELRFFPLIEIANKST